MDGDGAVLGQLAISGFLVGGSGEGSEPYIYIYIYIY